MTRIVLLTLAALLLASCGRQGDLARPGPLFGRGAEAPAQPSEAAQPDREGDEVEGTGERNTPQLDPSRRLDPASSEPIEGLNDPVGDRPPVRPNGA